jgi:hypothetical protein
LIQHVWRMDRLPYLIMKYQPCGTQSYGPLERLLDF